MLVPHAWIACGWHEQSILFQCPFLPESTRWYRTLPPWRLGEAPFAGLPKSPRCPQTSSRDRFVLATPDFRSASSLRFGHGHGYRCPSRTSESPVRARFEKDCIESGTNGTGRSSRAPDARIRREYHGREQPCAHCGIFRDPPDERFSLENLEQSHRQQ